MARLKKKKQFIKIDTITPIKKDIINELHKPSRINFPRRKVVIKGLNDLIQGDLVEMIQFAHSNANFRYILIVINCFSKFVWALPIKTKSAKDVTNAMSQILRKMKKIPKNFQSDMGKEFYNKEFKNLMKKYNINHYSVFSTKKASIVERVNRTLKNIMWKKFSLQGSYKWLDILQDVVNQYNNTVHTTIGIKPTEVNSNNEKELLNNVYNRIKMADKNTKFKLGDFVRISKYRKEFTKGYTPNWTNEIFKVRKVQLTNPTTYLLEDEKGEKILGGFYDFELQRAKHPGIYLVEKVLKRKGNKVYVKWLGFDGTHNSWIDDNNIL